MINEGEAILVVDDDPHVRRAVSRLLRNAGHVVVEAPDGPSAVALSLKHRPSLMVLDFMMPGMDGGTVLRTVREALKDQAPPTLLLTASGQQRERATDMGAAAGLSKPFRVNELLDAVQRHRRVKPGT